MNNNEILGGSHVIKLILDQSVVKLHIGDPIRLNAEEFERLSSAYFAEIERKFLQTRGTSGSRVPAGRMGNPVPKPAGVSSTLDVASLEECTEHRVDDGYRPWPTGTSGLTLSASHQTISPHVSTVQAGSVGGMEPSVVSQHIVRQHQ
jgi:hypothetical protein